MNIVHGTPVNHGNIDCLFFCILFSHQPTHQALRIYIWQCSAILLL